MQWGRAAKSKVCARAQHTVAGKLAKYYKLIFIITHKHKINMSKLVLQLLL